MKDAVLKIQEKKIKLVAAIAEQNYQKNTGASEVKNLSQDINNLTKDIRIIKILQENTKILKKEIDNEFNYTNIKWYLKNLQQEQLNSIAVSFLIKPDFDNNKIINQIIENLYA